MLLLVLLFAFFLINGSASAERIVSAAPSFTEILYALGAGPSVIGTTHYCDYPAEALKTEKIGDILNPNVEKIISLKPDIVFAGAWKWNVPEKLRAAGIKVIEVPDAQNLNDVFNRFRFIGKHIGREKQAMSLVDSMVREMESVKKRSGTRQSQKVYMEIDAGNWTIGGPSYLTEILKIVGAQNIFGDRKEPYITVTMESIVSRDPDLMMSLSRTKQEYESQSAWQALRPVREGKIVDKNAIDWNAITHQGSRLMEGIRQLEQALAKFRAGSASQRTVSTQLADESR